MGPMCYVTENLIGKGAYGTAHICKRKADGKRFVKKLVRLARLSNKERQASLSELMILSNVSHRNIIEFHEAWVEAGCNAVTITELCKCGDLLSQLRPRIEKQHMYSEANLQDMLVQLASCLHYLHSNGVAHRDLKSSNVFVSETGCLKLADFGLATVLQDGMSTTVCGTPNYMSPEALLELPYGVKNDIWALGCIMFELSALKMAFHAGSVPALTKKVTGGPLPSLPPSFSDDWKGVVKWMLTRDEDARPTAQDILLLPYLQEAIRRVDEQHGLALPAGSDGVIQLQQLPPAVASLAQQFADDERNAEVEAIEAAVHHKQQQLKFAPRALRGRLEHELREVRAKATALRAKLGLPEAVPGDGTRVVPPLRRISAPGPASTGHPPAAHFSRNASGPLPTDQGCTGDDDACAHSTGTGCGATVDPSGRQDARVGRATSQQGSKAGSSVTPRRQAGRKPPLPSAACLPARSVGIARAASLAMGAAVESNAQLGGSGGAQSRDRTPRMVTSGATQDEAHPSGTPRPPDGVGGPGTDGSEPVMPALPPGPATSAKHASASASGHAQAASSEPWCTSPRAPGSTCNPEDAGCSYSSSRCGGDGGGHHASSDVLVYMGRLSGASDAEPAAPSAPGDGVHALRHGMGPTPRQAAAAAAAAAWEARKGGGVDARSSGSQPASGAKAPVPRYMASTAASKRATIFAAPVHIRPSVPAQGASQAAAHAQAEARGSMGQAAPAPSEPCGELLGCVPTGAPSVPTVQHGRRAALPPGAPNTELLSSAESIHDFRAPCGKGKSGETLRVQDSLDNFIGCA